MPLTGHGEVLRMKLDVVFEHGVPLGRVALDPFVDVQSGYPASGAQRQMPLDTCRERKREGGGGGGSDTLMTNRGRRGHRKICGRVEASECATEIGTRARQAVTRHERREQTPRQLSDGQSAALTGERRLLGEQVEDKR